MALKAKVPGDKQRVISEEEAAELESYRKLGKIEDVSKTLGEVETLRGDKEKLTREGTLRRACQAQGLDYDALVELPGAAALDIEFKDVERQGKKVQVPFVKPAEGEKDAKPVELAAYTKSRWPRFAEALTLKSENPLPTRTLPKTTTTVHNDAERRIERPTALVRL